MKITRKENLKEIINNVFDHSLKMNLISKLLIGIIIVSSTCSIFAGDINGRFVVTNSGSTKLAVDLQINTITGSTALGGATIVFGFDTSSISLTSTPIKDVDYTYHNFSDNYYSPATITQPTKGRIWLNIDLPYNNNNHGTAVSDTSGWTDVVTIYFDITDVNGSANLYWLSNSPFWGIYGDDNLTLLEPNLFNNINFIYDITPPELVNASLLDSVNLEVEFTEQLDSTSVLNISNYSINNGINIIGITRSSNPKKVIINATAHSSGVQYTLTVNNVTDLAGNLISTTHNLTEYAFSPSNIDDGNLPTEFLLSQNYPNPFNPSTIINWQSPVAGHQTLKVYDVLGNEVATLVDEFRSAGSYKIEFSSENLASGVYIYCLKTAEFTQTKKMVLLR